MTMHHTGSCRCGLISAETNAEPFQRSYCHCRDCRKQTGAPVMAFVGFKEGDLVWHGEPKTWHAGGVTRSFCDYCGSQIGYRDAKLPGEVYLSLGFMDDPESYAPTLHAFTKRQLPFLHIDDDLPRYDGFSIER
ncbi:GFA family protein [Mesorhizobium sp. CAU 1732]|uniref:GFA family protein n=1 Tax=Mesorhizobium sp. CAU 1732 TaxID=3140358 RepID=UPI0032607396